MTEPSKQFAKDVAKQIEMRRRKRKLIFLAIWAAAIIAAILYLRCGRGWGLGGPGAGKGKRAGTGSASVTDAGLARCTVRVTAAGITVDGNAMKRDEAVAACKKTEGAMVTVTGDARQGDWDELRAALQAVGVKIYIRGELWDGKTPDGSAGSAELPR